MSEKLDPEEIKEIMQGIFELVKAVIQKYDGFIEKFVGDVVMALYGMHQSHEDDPIRAIRSVQKIQSLVEKLSTKVENKFSRPLTVS